MANWNRFHNTKELNIEGSTGPSGLLVSDIYQMNAGPQVYAGGYRDVHFWQVSSTNKNKGIYRPGNASGSPINVPLYDFEEVTQVPATDGRNLIESIVYTDVSQLHLSDDYDGFGTPDKSIDMLYQYGSRGYVPKYYEDSYHYIADTMIRVEAEGIQNTIDYTSVALDSIEVSVVTNDGSDQSSGYNDGHQTNTPVENGFSVTALPIFDSAGNIIDECVAILLIYSGPYFYFSTIHNDCSIHIDAEISVTVGPRSRVVRLSHSLIFYRGSN